MLIKVVFSLNRKVCILRITGIDALKGIAVISVIILHSVDAEFLMNSFAPLHIWQAVPVFMVLYGINNALSLNKINKLSLKELYSFRLLEKRFSRILIPALFVLSCQILIEYKRGTFANINLDTIYEMIFIIGFGPGSYFIPIILQSALILPLLFWIGKKSPIGLLVISTIISLVFEFLSKQLPIPPEDYRIIFVRYLFAISLGIWWIISKNNKSKKYIFGIGLVLSTIYIIAVRYNNFVLINEDTLWNSQHMPAYFYALMIYWIFSQIKFKESNVLSSIILLSGKASFHIFLMQMAYFRIKQLGIITISAQPFVYSAMNIVICVSIGILFYQIEEQVRGKLKKASSYKVKNAPLEN
jgi:peptidoglycan/LPS O-acetylase OafA/YrhL